MKFKQIILVFFIAISVSCLYTCEKILPSEPDPSNVMDAPIDDLTPAQNRKFLEGAEEFEEVYTKENGLGPIFVASSCASCHAGDNKGHLFTALTRFGQSDATGNKYLDYGAPQIQHNFLPGYSGEIIPSGASSTKIVAPIVAGSGFIEMVQESELLALADPNDLDGDGISGKIHWGAMPAWVTTDKNAIKVNGKYICKFGKKGGTYNLHQQVVKAFNQDIGITTSFMPHNPINYLEGIQTTPVGQPDLSDYSLDNTVFYIKTIQAPIQRDKDNPEVTAGASIFNTIQCNKCHVEKLNTGPSILNGLNYKTFYPYTDLLLHDMGVGLDDHYTEGEALSSEWKTPALWGLGLSKRSQGGQYYLLHDGRARSIEEAIEMHGGEAEKSVANYGKLSVSEKKALIKFLESL